MVFLILLDDQQLLITGKNDDGSVPVDAGRGNIYCVGLFPGKLRTVHEIFQDGELVVSGLDADNNR